MNLIAKFFIDEEAAVVAEYAFLLGLIFIVVTTFLTSFGTRVNSTISNVTNQLPI